MRIERTRRQSEVCNMFLERKAKQKVCKESAEARNEHNTAIVCE